MKRLYVVANWKSNKTILETKEWFDLFKASFQTSNKQIIVCPPFTLLSEAKSLIINYKLPITLGAQDISPFGEGAYTGEINGKQIKEFADYVIIGHLERRKYFSIEKEMLQKQNDMARRFGLKTIYCASHVDDFVPVGVTLLTYEPPSSISPGPADSPENAEQVGLKLCQKYSTEGVLYGGNVTPQNVQAFTTMPHISGVLVGRASLDVKEFTTIIHNA